MKLNFKRALPALAAALVMAGPLLAQAQQGVTDTEILIGEIAPLTGPASVGSVALSLGTKMAVAEVNAAGGINGRKIRVISEDDGYVVTRAVQAARKLITSDKVFALAAISGSAPSVALLPMLKETGIPAINVLSFPDSLHTPVVPNIYVAGASHQDSVEALVTELNKLYPNKKWAVVTQDDELGSLMREGWDRAQAKYKLNVVYKTAYRRGQKDFSAEMLSATKAGAEVLLAGGIVTENVAMVKELERLGSKIPVGATWIGRYPSALQAMGSAAGNFYMIDYVVPEAVPESRLLFACDQAAARRRPQARQPLHAGGLRRHQDPDRGDAPLRQGPDVGLHHQGNGRHQGHGNLGDGTHQLHAQVTLLTSKAQPDEGQRQDAGV